MTANKRLPIALGLAFALTVPAYADCLLPSPPAKIPDGQTAAQQEMVSAMQTLKEYNGDVDTYLKCLEFEHKQGHLTNADQDRLHDAAVETLTRIANKFNAQVRTFKSKNG